MNAGSMADIAFLLLIFFLVTTTIQEDQGVLVRLPEYLENQEPIDLDNSNVLTVLINTEDKLLIESESATVRDIPGLIREHVISPRRTPKQAVISLTHDRGTSYATYLQVYDALKAGYRSLWDDKSNERYGKIYAHLSQAEQKSIRTEIPMIISEAEPSDWEE